MLVQILKTNKVRNLKDTTAKLLIDRKMARAIDEVDESTNKNPAKTNKIMRRLIKSLQ